MTATPTLTVRAVARAADRTIALLLFLFLPCLAMYLGLFGHTACNRINDSWWHIAAADEFLRTGNFAADPFLQGAPAFAQFGLTDAVTAALAKATGSTAAWAWSWALALNGVVAAAACMLCGRLMAGYWVAGALALGLWLAAFGDLGLHGLAFPFYASLPCLQALLAWFLHAPPDRRWQPGRASAAGIGLGFLFGLHAWTGLWAVGAVASVAAFDLLCAPRSTRPSPAALLPDWPRGPLTGMAFMGVVFLVVAQSWLRLQLSLAPLLAHSNAHRIIGYHISGMAFGLATASALLISLGAWWSRRQSPLAGQLTWFAVWSWLSLALAAPALNRRLAAATSDYMANRVIMFAAFAVAAGLAVRLLAGAFQRRPALVCVVGAAWLAALAWPLAGRVAVEVYLVRTHDLDAHWCGHLLRVQNQGLSGRAVLSDPYTSFFARGMLGAYALTVPAGHASPAVEYESRDALVRAALRSGTNPWRHDNVSAVLVEKKHGYTAEFTGMSPVDIQAAWVRHGWHVGYEDADLLMLQPPPAGAP
ncbi:MAG: hypothetical protein K8T26_02995 [Lentisphaerae bacterium]|nr:hypothetical protein [Lentisphaerota bacterium]